MRAALHRYGRRLLALVALSVSFVVAYVLVSPVLPRSSGARIERPASAPTRIPQWAWEIYRWQSAHRLGPRPEGAPTKLPSWYWAWRAWRQSLG